jgi:plasmid stabilization system protein ParE
LSLQLVIRPAAESDVAEAYEWYEERRQGLGDDLLLSVEATLAAICERPASFPIVHQDIRRALIRRFPFGVFYILDKTKLIVLAVFHARRDPKQWQSRS